MYKKSNHKVKTSMSLLLALCVLFSVLPYKPYEAENNSGVEIVAASMSNIKYLDTDVLESYNFAGRLPGEENLNSYVFLNQDGSQTALIFPENIKYIDESGNIVEKDTTLVKDSQGGYTVKANDYYVNLPDNIKDGYTFAYKGNTVKITPYSVSSFAKKDGNIIVYDNVFGDGTALRFTPDLNGIKEDIILGSYTEVNSYNFVLDAAELVPVEKDGIISLCDSDGTKIIDFRQIYAYDANGKLEVGSISLEQIDVLGHFAITVSISRDFLTADDTVYPVTIDPPIYESSDGSYIQDAPIFANMSTTNFGSNTNNTVGTVSSTYGEGRTAMKLYGLTENSIYKTLDAEEIKSVKIVVDEATGASTPLFINLYRITNDVTWNENTVNWNNVGSYDTSYNAGNYLNQGAEFKFDITNFVKGWKNYSYTRSYSVLFVSSNTTTGTFRQFYSSDYSGSSGTRPYIELTYKYKCLMDEGIYYIKSKQLDKFVQPVGGVSAGENAYIELRDFSGNDAQKWFVKIEADGYYSITNLSTGYMLTVHNGQRTENLRLTQESNHNSTGQKWRIYMTTYCGFAFKPESSNLNFDGTDWTNLVMSVNDGNDGNGAQVAQRSYAYNNSFKDEWYLVPVDITDGALNIQNRQLGTNVRPKNATISENVGIELWTANNNLSQKWVFVRLSNGYYKISPQNNSLYALSIASGSEHAENGVVRLESFSSANARQQWLVYKVPNGYVFKAKSSGTENLVLSVSEGNLGNGAVVSQRAYINNLSYKEEWLIPNYYLLLNSNYDNGYCVRFLETSSESEASISSYVNLISERYKTLLGLNVYMKSPTYFFSDIDWCKGVTTSANIDTLCIHSGTSHTERSSVIADYSIGHTGNDVSVNILWTAHRITSTASSGAINYNRSCTVGHNIYMLNVNQTNRNQKSTATLMHEINHQIGAPDHYHELNKYGVCKFADICSVCGTNPRPATCIMNTTSRDISSTDIICDQCLLQIRAHLSDHH